MSPWLGLIAMTALGYGVLRLIGLKMEPLESAALGWLIGSVLVTFSLFWWGWLGGWSIALALAMGIFFWAGGRFLKSSSPLESASEGSDAPYYNGSLQSKGFMALVWILIAFQLVYALGCVLWLPTQYWDSFHFWHLRARYFFVEGTLGFGDEAAWTLGGEKIHYPLHLPLLKALLCRIAGEWKDPWALGVDLINFISFIALVYRFMKRACGRSGAAIAVYLTASLPLVGIHLSAGLGDLTVAVFLALSVLFWERWRVREDEKSLALSGFMMAAAAWSKNDPLALYLPVLFLATIFWARAARPLAIFSIGVFLPLSPWFIFKAGTGLGLNPNPADRILEFHPEAFAMFPAEFFSFSGFGMLWILAVPLIFWRTSGEASKSLWPLAWGCLAMVLAVYAFTVNFEFLANSMTVQRSLLQVAPLMAIALAARAMDVLGSRPELIAFGELKK
ncbi:MAG: glycosyltransferase family 39 protein [Nitrospinae bacterium]|nr:glycosyltransferase family 39 protein [Nitrospinota bacterium]